MANGSKRGRCQLPLSEDGLSRACELALQSPEPALEHPARGPRNVRVVVDNQNS